MRNTKSYEKYAYSIPMALIHQLKYREQVDWEMMQRYCMAVSGSGEFFLEKGAGWALRQYSKFRPDLVRKFMACTDHLNSRFVRK